LAFGLSVLGLNFLPTGIVVALISVGAVSTFVYVVYSRRVAAPVLDLSLLSVPTMRASVFGGFVFRVGIGALPFLLPLMLQLAFGMNPFQSGLITFATALGAMGMKAATAFILRTFGFRTVLVVNALISAALLALVGLFTPTTPVWVMIAVLTIGGFFRSLEFTCINTIAYADLDRNLMSRATPLVSVGQQLSISSGVAMGALIVDLVSAYRGHPTLTTEDFAIAFFGVALIAGSSALIFARMPRDAGAEMANRLPPPKGPEAQRGD